jgi:very-short-patch-repair endonuclease
VKSSIEEQLIWQIGVAGLPAPEREYKFHPQRRWRFDGAYPSLKLAFEVEGGIHNRGRHVRPEGYEKDVEKYNAATCLNWRVLRFTSAMVEDGRALRLLEEQITKLEAAWTTSKF